MNFPTKILLRVIASLVPVVLAGCNTASIAPLAISAAGAAGGYLAGGTISDSEGAKIGGMSVGLIAASQAYEYLENNGEKAIREAYEQGKREARTEVSNAYWREAIGADGSEYKLHNNDKNIRKNPYNSNIYRGIIYGE